MFAQNRKRPLAESGGAGVSCSWRVRRQSGKEKHGEMTKPKPQVRAGKIMTLQLWLIMKHPAVHAESEMVICVHGHELSAQVCG